METCQFNKKIVPVPPPLPKLSFHRTRLSENGVLRKGVCLTSTVVNKTWDTLFDEGYRADVLITTDANDIIYAHSCILGIASPVFENILKQSRNHSRRRPQIISICGVPADAVRVFIRFLYSSRYEEDQLKEHAVQVLALAHAYAIPSLKLLCELKIEQQGMLTVENVVDIFQLAMLFDAAGLSAICYHFILNNFKYVSATEGWRVMKDTHPILENKIQISLLHENSVKKQRQKKMEERKIYKQLHEAMEAVVHFFRDGCGTAGSQYRIMKGDKSHCPYDICKILESLIRHFGRCKKRVTGDCINCNRICGILELHSRICANPNVCRVPLCRKFRNRRNGENTKESVKWRILAGKIVRSKSISGAPFFSLESI